ncbi:MAG: hypothetical protein A3K67_01680 [Euryarchaeota archaeon RBG_16_62_10]|nr:MAG: hypothetical protein A3K67_01680 [Euryarchaeota archaeon RBG_16_62_10]
MYMSTTAMSERTIDASHSSDTASSSTSTNLTTIIKTTNPSNRPMSPMSNPPGRSLKNGTTTTATRATTSIRRK